jgi:NADH:ubiquinone reductase (non-electrogenic)|mmetsp:Transcript_110867/g.174825  ORF Transcript_110867/g.174825 Transcript_110867/m.174825 type:complete len:514 (-) Transcript_110867:89-1630(-)
MAALRKYARRAGQVTILGGGLVGGYRVLEMWLNDNMDDISYGFSDLFRRQLAERKKVVVLGTGWGATSFIKKFDPKLYDVTVVSPRPFFFYTPLLCGSTTGIVAPGNIIEPIRDVNRSVRYLNVKCEDVDLVAKKVTCKGSVDQLTLDYDHLVVSVGAQPNTFGIKGIEQYAMFLKEVEHGRAVRQKLLNNIEEAEVALAAGDLQRAKKLLHVVIVGGGPTGVEFSGELCDFIKSDLALQYPNLAEYFEVTLVEALPSLLVMFKKEIQQTVAEHLVSQGVKMHLNAMVTEAEPDKVHLKFKDGTKQTLDFGMLLWVGGVCMRPFVKQLCEKIGKEAGQNDRRGLVVDECLRVKGTALGEVFAVGDCAFSGKPPTAQVAMQQGKYLGRMFRRGHENEISSADAPPFAFKDKGKMAYIGDKKAVAEVLPAGVLRLGGGKMSDFAFWRSLYGEAEDVNILGWTGFALWRYTYFNCMFSGRNQFGVTFDWSRIALFGRPACSSSQGTVAACAEVPQR